MMCLRSSVLIALLLCSFVRTAGAQDETDSSLYIAPNDPAPTMPGLEDNPQSPEKIELGRLLFFDPVLSGDNTMACATCHHPDFGLSDGRTFSMGLGAEGIGPEREGGVPLERHSPSLWNAGFQQALFWDGRAATLEEQADIVMRDPNEMNETPEGIVQELRNIPEYVSNFEKAFPDDEVPLVYENLLKALGSFQRSLHAMNSPYDDYRWGDEDALTPEEKHGMELFFSTEWNCGTCHPAPLFQTNEFVVTGVPELGKRDEGRRAITGEGPQGAFKIPSLRNIALSPPYMHNGELETLEEVIRFYRNAAGFDHPDLDPRIKWIDMSETDLENVIAFLHALTDETNTPEVPHSVPSGFPVPNPTR